MEGKFDDTDGSPRKTSELLEELSTRIDRLSPLLEDPQRPGLYNFPGSGDYPA